MTSIRMNIQLALVTRLAALGWDAQLRGTENTGDSPIKATVFPVTENKFIATIDQYQATLSVVVEIKVRFEDAHPTTDEGNVYRYLDRMVALAETKIHNPDEWGLNPGFTDVSIDGHDVSDPSTEDTELYAQLRLTFKYRHNYQDPDT